MKTSVKRKKKNGKRNKKLKATGSRSNKCTRKIPEIDDENGMTTITTTSSSTDVMWSVMTPLNSPLFVTVLSEDEIYDNKFNKAYVLNHLDFFAQL